MQPTVADLKAAITTKLHGTSLRVCSDIEETIYQAALTMLLRIDPKSTKRTQPIVNAVYWRIFDYICPDDVKKIIDLRPQSVMRPFWDGPTLHYSNQFDQFKGHGRIGDNILTLEYSNAGKYLRISKELNSFNGVLDPGQQVTTSAGVWTGGADAVNLRDNTFDYVQGQSSIMFNLDGSTNQGFIDIIYNNVIDLSPIEDFGSLFLWMKFPDADAITSIDLLWGSGGSSVTDYWHQTVTQQQAQLAFKDGWNLMRFDWNVAIPVGNPDASAINYVKISVNYDGTVQNGLLYNGVNAKTGKMYDLVYYSEFMFRDETTGEWIQRPNSDGNFINVDPLAYQILINETARLVCQEAKGRNMKQDVDFFTSELEGDRNKDNGKPGQYDKYLAQYPSEALTAVEDYYQFSDFFDQNC